MSCLWWLQDYSKGNGSHVHMHPLCRTESLRHRFAADEAEILTVLRER